MINWGILGLGRMGVTFANAIGETTNSKLICVASNSGKKFKEFKNFSYDDLINNKKFLKLVKKFYVKNLFLYH
jgi:predicted dehydrogenase